jgi:hypothetical protein
MNDLCDEEAVEEFAVLNAEQVIEAWLSDLHDKQAELSQYGADTSMFELLEDAPVKVRFDWCFRCSDIDKMPIPARRFILLWLKYKMLFDNAILA